MGYLSADAKLTSEVDDVFLRLASGVPAPAHRTLLSAPNQMHAHFVACLARVAEAARQGRPARVVVKANALTDPGLIEALLAAGQAGADIDLIIRGACMLRPGVPGHSERIRVRSVVGRFLEHSRILYFRWGPDDADEQLYLSSADWMSRNMFRRVEVAWPIRDRALRQRVIDECLVPYLHDRADAWLLQSDGEYRAADGAAPSAQRALMRRCAAQA